MSFKLDLKLVQDILTNSNLLIAILSQKNQCGITADKLLPPAAVVTEEEYQISTYNSQSELLHWVYLIWKWSFKTPFPFCSRRPTNMPIDHKAHKCAGCMYVQVTQQPWQTPTINRYMWMRICRSVRIIQTMFHCATGVQTYQASLLYSYNIIRSLQWSQIRTPPKEPYLRSDCPTQESLWGLYPEGGNQHQALQCQKWNTSKNPR